MKKNIFKGIIMSAILMISMNVNAQINLNNLGKVISSAVGSDLTSVLTGQNNVTKEIITGTWSYQEPSVVFESSDVLKAAGGQVASSAIENKLETQFAKVGITAGKFLITFGSDGTFSFIKNGNVSSSGTYTINGMKITFSYLEGTANISGYAQMKNNVLSITFDSSKLLDVMGKINQIRNNNSLNTISSLIGSYEGMKSGLTFEKYVAPVVTPITTVKSTTSTSTKKSTKKTTKKTAKKITKKKSKKK
jgi:hypothetical protein